jgi:putative Mn2+ efflux pump MntP
MGDVMELFKLVLTAIGLGFGLAMDAFSVSLANGLHEPKMKFPRVLLIAGTFAVFQGVMPLLGWVAVHTVLEYFSIIGKFIPWIAFGLLSFIGGKMIIEGARGDCACGECEDRLTFGLLMVQGVATSIDALSVGFAIAENTLVEALVSVAIISVLTLGICIAGIIIGKLFGQKFAGKASIFGGIILVAIGLEILITSFL